MSYPLQSQIAVRLVKALFSKEGCILSGAAVKVTTLAVGNNLVDSTLRALPAVNTTLLLVMQILAAQMIHR